ncbi:MAG: rhamnogalacturonan acetylesterase [Fibrobacterota bacterium]|nr:MAG: rhamnogalacturonan acetylesterase [Fibrobacterota bacterium]
MIKKNFIPIILFLVMFAYAATTSVQRIVLIGDSTVATYAVSKYPMAGWGQVLGQFFKAGTVQITNLAAGGKSTRTYISEGHWAKALATLQKGDVLMIQFGHNDRNTSDTSIFTDTAAYRKNLIQFATEARARGAHPIFITPMNMNQWDKGQLRRYFTMGAYDYRGVMIRVAAEMKAPVLDLEEKSAKMMDTLGYEYLSKFHFLGLDSGEYPNFPKGSTDGTHFQEMGALENARMISEELARLRNDSIASILAPSLAPLYKVTVASLPDSVSLTTKSRYYPKGANITLKIRLAPQRAFLRWTDASNNWKVIDTLKRITFVQDSFARTIVAVSANRTASENQPQENISGLRQQGKVLINSTNEMIEIRDITGMKITASSQKEYATSQLPAGFYIATFPSKPQLVTKFLVR